MISVILLAGGTGSRMGSPIPKQYLPLQGTPIALFSYHRFVSLEEVKEIIVVCEPAYKHLFASEKTLFASPGPLRQDSVYSGFLQTTQEIVMIHDSARPFFQAELVPQLLDAVRTTGAAALGSPVVNTIKQCNSDHLVEKTLDRSKLWEIQTPQAVKRDLLARAFAYIHQNKVEVTDDLSMIEAIGHPTQIVPASPQNFKITTPFDLTIAKSLCAIN